MNNNKIGVVVLGFLALMLFYFGSVADNFPVPPISNDATVNTSKPTVPSTTSGSYKVTKVVDGDTIDVDIDGEIERLRLIGINTPETVDPRKSVECFGREASNKAKELLLNQFVTLEADSSQGERDRYGRLLRYVYLPDETNFNLYMIKAGYANEYTYSKPYRYQTRFKLAEQEARLLKRGLWADDACTLPTT